MILIKKIFNKIYTKYLGFLCQDIYIGEHALVDYRCEIEKKTNIVIKSDSILYKKITIYKDKQGYFQLGTSSHIAPYTYFLIGKNSMIIGNNVAIAKSCSFFCVSNSIPENHTILFKDSYYEGDIIIGDNVFIGTNCVILPNTTVQNNVVVAANSTMKGVLETGWLYGGNPVQKIKRIKKYEC